jgi:hypothetical protein
MTAGDDQSWDYYQDFFQNRFLPAVKGRTVIFLGGDVHKNRLPPRKPDWPVEAVSSAAALGWPYLMPRFGLVELDDVEARFFLYKDSKVEYTGRLAWSSGRFRTNMFVAPKPAPRLTTNRARAQRASAMKQLAASR